MNNKIENLITLLLVFACTCLMSFSQTKIDTVYIKYPDATNNTTKDSAFYYRVRIISQGVLKAEDFSIDDSIRKCSGYYKSFDPYVKHGYFVFYINDSIVDFEGNYIEDKLSGVWKNYYSSGELWFTATYSNGLKNGILKGYFKTGEAKRIEKYKKGKRVKGQCYTKFGKDTAYYEMYIWPSFPGGEKAMIDYFVKKIIYPEQAKINKIEGISYISYIVNVDGSISDVEVVKGKENHPLLDQAAMDCVRKMPTWTPGYIDGSPVKMKRVQRIKFLLPQ